MKKTIVIVTLFSFSISLYSQISLFKDKEYIRQLDNMYYVDQEIRKAMSNYYDDSLKMDSFVFAMELVDSINLANLYTLSKEKGFPTKAKTGDNGVSTAWLVLWHHRGLQYKSNPTIQKLIPLIQNEMDAGRLKPDFLAMHEDYYRDAAGIPHLYGSLFGYYRSVPKYDSIRIENVLEVDIRRKEAGMQPVLEHIKSLNLKTPLGLMELEKHYKKED